MEVSYRENKENIFSREEEEMKRGIKRGNKENGR